MTFEKTVRFAEVNEAYSYPSTPSPTFSSSTLSTAGPGTPPPTRNDRSPYRYKSPLSDDVIVTGSVSIHNLFELRAVPKFNFDVSHDPAFTVGTLTSRQLSSAATTPPLPSLTIVCKLLPWRLVIRPSSGEVGAFVTVADVLRGLYRELRLPVWLAEYEREPPFHQARVKDAFIGRCERCGASEQQEFQKGVKRVDFLMGSTRFLGLSRTDGGPDIWRLSVSTP